MENDGANHNRPDTSPQSDSSIPVYPIAPFVTPPQNITANPTPSYSPQSTNQPITSSPTQGKSLSSDISSEKPLATSTASQPSHPLGVSTQVNNGATQALSPNFNSNPLPSPQASSPITSVPSLHTDEVSGAPVTVDAVPVHESKRPAITENVPPPSRGALIAFGVLSGFFIIVIISLLVWRKRRNSKLAQRDEEAQTPRGKPDSERPSEKNSSSTNNLVESSPKTRGPGPDAGDTNPKPFAARSILRPARPPSLHIDPKMHGQELNQTKAEQDSRHLKLQRPGSWRSSIASVWATLGLPSRVLQDTNVQPWDGASSNSRRSDQNLLHSPFPPIEEPAVESPSENSNTPTSVSEERSSNSPTLSDQSFGDNISPHRRPPSSRISHASSSSLQEEEDNQSPKVIKSGEERSSFPNSISEDQTHESHTTTSNDGVESSVASSSPREQINYPSVPTAKTQILNPIRA